MFSPTEQKVIDIIGDAKFSIARLTEIYFNSYYIPRNPRAVIVGAIFRINIKCKKHNLNWFINKSGGGKKGKQVWKEVKS